MTEQLIPTPDAGHAPVTVLGLGLMGQALAGAFLADGHPTNVWNRTAAKAEQLATRIDVELPEFVNTLTDRAVAAGRGGDSYAAMIEQFRKPIATRP